MNSLFNYSTLLTRLDPATKCLFVTLNEKSTLGSINSEMLFELESLLSWASSKIEINAIYLSSSFANFSPGIDQTTLAYQESRALEKIQLKLQRIVFAMLQLPQTIIVDLQDGAYNLALELALGADIRIASVGTKLAFDHAKIGLTPAAGAMSLLQTIIPTGLTRSWIMRSKVLGHQDLMDGGFISDFYNSTNKDDLRNELLNAIVEQAPIQRIQTKMGLFEFYRDIIERGFENDRKISQAAMISEDWKVKPKSQEFMKAKSMKQAVKLSLIKNGPEEADH